MLRAVARALEVRARQGITGVATEDQIDRAIRGAGLAIRDDRPYVGNLQGRLFRRTVCVRRGVSSGRRRSVKAHELGHHVLGHGDADAYSVRGRVLGARDEVETEIFAWTLALGRPSRTLRGLTVQMHRAHDAGLPLDWLCDVLSMLAVRLPERRRALEAAQLDDLLGDPLPHELQNRRLPLARQALRRLEDKLRQGQPTHDHLGEQWVW